MYVYFIHTTGKPRRMKIGKSKNPLKRLAELQTGSPHKLTLFGTIKCRNDRDSYELESIAHEVFNKERKQGEWFRCTDYLMVRIMDMIASSPTGRMGELYTKDVVTM